MRLLEPLKVSRWLVAALVAPTLITIASPGFAVCPDPAKACIESLSYMGSGCPDSSIGQSIAANKRSFTLIFDSNAAYLGSAVEFANQLKACAVRIVVTFPAGASAETMTLAYRGYVQLSAGVTALQRSHYFMTGMEKGPKAETEFLGPMARDHLLTDKIALGFDSDLERSDVFTISAKVQLLGSLGIGADHRRLDRWEAGVMAVFTRLRGTVHEARSNLGAAMMIYLNAILLGLVLSLSLSRPAVAQPNPNNIYVQSVTYGGSGCAPGTVGPVITTNRLRIGLGFESYTASAGPTILPAESSKDCQININVRVPVGLSAAQLVMMTRGSAVVGKKRLATTHMSIVVDGGEAIEKNGLHVPGGRVRDVRRKTVVPLQFNEPVARTLPIVLQTEAHLDSREGAAEPSLISISSIDIRVRARKMLPGLTLPDPPTEPRVRVKKVERPTS